MRWLLIACLPLAGCVSPNISPPLDTSLVPNDCLNQQQLSRYLEHHAQQPQYKLESQEQYEHRKGQYKARMWNLRYNCNRV